MVEKLVDHVAPVSPDTMMAESVALPAIVTRRARCATLAAHRLLHHAEDLLADTAFGPLPGRLHRNLPSLLLLRRQIVKLAAAGGLDLLQRVLILLRGDLVGVVGRLVHRLLKR